MATFKLETHQELVKPIPSAPDIWVERRSLVSDTGFRLDNIGSGRESQYFFRYTEGHISCELIASRYDADGRKPMDNWRVQLDLALRNHSPGAGGPIGLEKAKEIASNLKEALMVWPQAASLPPIKQVKVLMKNWPVWNPAWGDWL